MARGEEYEAKNRFNSKFTNILRVIVKVDVGVRKKFYTTLCIMYEDGVNHLFYVPQDLNLCMN